jgi:RHS repeat-associated protein
VTKFFYNLEDRLERVEDGSGNVIAEYYYDPFGRRLWKDVGGTRTCFHYSDEGLVGEYEASGTVIKTYGYKPGSTWSTDPLFMKVGADYYYYHNDHIGTPQKMTSVTGAVVWSATYSSFGEASVGTETVTNNLRLGGQFLDAESELHYNWFRYYDPKTGRYLREDPVGFIGGTNYYLYVSNNPIIYVDSTGLIKSGSFNAGKCKEVGRVIVPQIATGDPLYSYEAERLWRYLHSCTESSDACYCAYESTKRRLVEVFENFPTKYEVKYQCVDFCGNEYSISLMEQEPPLEATWSRYSTVTAPWKMIVIAGNTRDFIHCSCEPPLSPLPLE